MPLYRATGNLVIRPCDTCLALVLHEEGRLAKPRDLAASDDVQDAPWRPFPHNAPGGPRCIGGGSKRSGLPAPRIASAAAAARRVRSPEATKR